MLVFGGGGVALSIHLEAATLTQSDLALAPAQPERDSRERASMFKSPNTREIHP